MEAPWLSGFCSRCPHPGPLLHTAISNRPQYIHHPDSPPSHNSPPTSLQQVSAHNLMTLPPHGLQKPILCQEVIMSFCSSAGSKIETVSAARAGVLITMPPGLVVYQLQVFIICITKAQDLSRIHRASQPPCNTFCAAPSSPGIKPNQCT